MLTQRTDSLSVKTFYVLVSVHIAFPKRSNINIPIHMKHAVDRLFTRGLQVIEPNSTPRCVHSVQWNVTHTV